MKNIMQKKSYLNFIKGFNSTLSHSSLYNSATKVLSAIESRALIYQGILITTEGRK